MDYLNEITLLKQQLQSLTTIVHDLQLKVDELSAKKNESFYQKFLEKQLKSSHKKYTLGISDITTDTDIIEIKHWNQFKHLLGQILTYNHTESNNKILWAYFFGPIPTNSKLEEIKTLFYNNKINIRHFTENKDGYTQIEDVLIINDVQENPFNDFHLWLDQHIEYKKDSILKLSDVCELYLGKHKIHSSLSSKYKKEIEIFIKDKFKNINWIQNEYKIINNDRTIRRIRGWLNFSIL